MGMEGDAGGYVFFDGGVLPQTPDRLQLRLVTDVVGLPSTPVPQEERPRAGPFTFGLSVRVIPGRIVDTPQRVEAEGTAIALKRIAVTPSETRIALHLSPAPGRDWLYGSGPGTRRAMEASSTCREA